MPNEINQETFRRLAKLGAQARLEQIELERKAILAAFPDLSGRTAARPAHKLDGGKTVAAEKPARRTRRMTATQRKAVSDRMKKFWADRRKAKA